MCARPACPSSLSSPPCVLPCLHPTSVRSIYTHLNLYYGNPDGIKPTIYQKKL